MAPHVHTTSATTVAVDLILLSPFVVAAVVYVAAAVSQPRSGRRWPWYRTASWLAGLAAAASGFVGPLALAAHESFTAHMGAHLLVGMLAPLLLVLGAPMTLALRTLAVASARRLSRMLRSMVARVLTRPVVAAMLNVGGLWVVYRGPLYELLQTSWIVHVFVMLHFLAAGSLYTAALVGIDPSPHRAGFALRAGVLISSLAVHGVVAKLLYAYPPAGVATADAQAGAQLMFYGGDAVDFVLIVLLCAEWYRVTGRALARGGAPAVTPRGGVV